MESLPTWGCCLLLSEGVQEENRPIQARGLPPLTLAILRKQPPPSRDILLPHPHTPTRPLSVTGDATRACAVQAPITAALKRASPSDAMIMPLSPLIAYHDGGGDDLIASISDKDCPKSERLRSPWPICKQSQPVPYLLDPSIRSSLMSYLQRRSMSSWLLSSLQSCHGLSQLIVYAEDVISAILPRIASTSSGLKRSSHSSTIYTTTTAGRA